MLNNNFDKFLQVKSVLARRRKTYRGYSLKNKTSVVIVSETTTHSCEDQRTIPSWLWLTERGEILMKFTQSVLHKQTYWAGKWLYKGFIPAGRRTVLPSSSSRLAISPNGLQRKVSCWHNTCKDHSPTKTLSYHHKITWCFRPPRQQGDVSTPSQQESSMLVDGSWKATKYKCSLKRKC